MVLQQTMPRMLIHSLHESDSKHTQGVISLTLRQVNAKITNQEPACCRVTQGAHLWYYPISDVPRRVIAYSCSEISDSRGWDICRRHQEWEGWFGGDKRIDQGMYEIYSFFGKEQCPKTENGNNTPYDQCDSRLAWVATYLMKRTLCVPNRD